MIVRGKFKCFVDGKNKLYPIRNVAPNINYDNIDAEIEIEEPELPDEIEKVTMYSHHINKILRYLKRPRKKVERLTISAPKKYEVWLEPLVNKINELIAEK